MALCRMRIMTTKEKRFIHDKARSSTVCSHPKPPHRCYHPIPADPIPGWPSISSSISAKIFLYRHAGCTPPAKATLSVGFRGCHSRKRAVILRHESQGAVSPAGLKGLVEEGESGSKRGGGGTGLLSWGRSALPAYKYTWCLPNKGPHTE